MANVHDDSAGAEHPGFLQKLEAKLHIGHRHKDEGVVPATGPQPTDPAVASKGTSTATDAPAGSSPVKQDIPDEETKATDTSNAQGGEFFDSEEVFSKAQEGEHHEGVPTFLVALPDQDLPSEGTKEHLHHVTAGQASEGGQYSSEKGLDSEEVFSNAQQGEHHGGVPTFLVALPDQEIPGEVDREVSSDVAGKDANKSGVKQEFDSEEVFAKAQQGEHHEGVPTFLVALPGQDLPSEETKENLHHVSAERTEDA